MSAESADAKLVLLVRDPWWLFAHWSGVASSSKFFLRVFDVTGLEFPKFRTYFDLRLEPHQTNVYIDAGKPDAEWIAEIGAKDASGKWAARVRSNRVKTPRAVAGGHGYDLSSYQLFKIEDE